MDRSILLIVKKFDRYRISTNQNKKDGRWNSKIYYAIYSKTNLRKRYRYVSTDVSRAKIVYPCFQNSFVSVSYTKKKVFPLCSLIEKGKCNRIYESSNRSSVIIHRKSCTETKFTSGGDFLLSVALATMTLLKLLNERGSGMENEVIPGTTNFRVPCVFQFA